jgi:hypothetical protein
MAVWIPALSTTFVGKRSFRVRNRAEVAGIQYGRTGELPRDDNLTNNKQINNSSSGQVVVNVEEQKRLFAQHQDYGIEEFVVLRDIEDENPDVNSVGGQVAARVAVSMEEAVGQGVLGNLINDTQRHGQG